MRNKNLAGRRARLAVIITFAAAAFMAAGALTFGRQLAPRASHAAPPAAAETPRPHVNMMMAATIWRDGQEIQPDKAGDIRPGDLVTYTVVSRNDGGVSAKNFRARGRVPAGTTYVGGSALSEGAELSFSIDGGKSFHARPTIEEKQADGSVRLVPAPAAMYTDVTFTYRSQIEPRATVTGSYQVYVK